MAIPMDALFGDALKTADKGMTDLLYMGGNSGLGVLEEPGLKPILADQTSISQNFPVSTMQDIKRQNVFDAGAAIVENALDQAVVKNYGPPILVFLALIGFSVVIFGRN